MKNFLTMESCDFRINGSAKLSSIEIYDCHISDVVDFFGVGNILEEIGRDACKKYFNLEEKP